MELERQENILLVCHQAVLRCLYAYAKRFLIKADSLQLLVRRAGTSALCVAASLFELPRWAFRDATAHASSATTSRPRSCPTSASHCTVRPIRHVRADLAALIRLTPKAYGCEEERYTVPIEAVDTTRPKPSKLGTPLPSGAQSPVGGVRTATPLNAPRDWSAAIVRCDVNRGMQLTAYSDDRSILEPGRFGRLAERSDGHPGRKRDRRRWGCSGCTRCGQRRRERRAG